MAYPTGVLSKTLEDIDRRMISIKATCQQVRSDAAAGNIPAATVIGLHQRLLFDKTQLQAAATTPGIAVYARDQKDDQNLDVVAEFNAVIAALDNVTGWVTTNFPKDASGYLLREQFNGAGTVERTFTPAQTAGLRTQLDALIATIA